MREWDYGIIIVGAGVVGACSTIALTQEGYRVLLLDRDRFPRRKSCGEGIIKEQLALAKG